MLAGRRVFVVLPEVDWNQDRESQAVVNKSGRSHHFARSRLMVRVLGDEPTDGLQCVLHLDSVSDGHLIEWRIQELNGRTVDSCSSWYTEAADDSQFAIQSHVEDSRANLFFPFAVVDTQSDVVRLVLTLLPPDQQVASAAARKAIATTEFDITLEYRDWDPVKQWGCLIGLAVLMAKIDGPLISSDIKAMRHWLETYCDMSAAQAELRDALKDFDANSAGLCVRDLLGEADRKLYYTNWATDFLAFMGDLAWSDSRLSEAEIHFFALIYHGLHLPDDGLEEAIRKLRASGAREHERERESPSVASGRHSRFQSDDPYVILGLSKGSSRIALEEAYRSLLKLYHPDFVAHVAPEIRELAERRTVAINSAAEKLRRIIK